MLHRDRPFVLLATMLVAVIFWRYSPQIFRPSASQHSPEEQYPGLGPMFTMMGGHDVAWELPASGPPKAVVFYAHGCHHACGDMWPRSEGCPGCLGLPEEMRIRLAILRRGYAVIGISSEERVKGCWREIKEDGGEGVARVLEKIIKKLNLNSKPFIAMGASSGGQLALLLPRVMKVHGICAEVRGVEPEELKLSGGASYPPTVFIHMPRDEDNAAQIVANIAALRDQGVPVAELRVAPRPVTPEFLTSRASDINQTMAEGIVEALTEGGFLDLNGMLLEPPRPSLERWGPLVQPIVGNLTLALDKSQVTELLNLAWAKHEAVSDHVDLALEWLVENKGRVDVKTLRKNRMARAQSQTQGKLL